MKRKELGLYRYPAADDEPLGDAHATALFRRFVVEALKLIADDLGAIRKALGAPESDEDGNG